MWWTALWLASALGAPNVELAAAKAAFNEGRTEDAEVQFRALTGTLEDPDAKVQAWVGLSEAHRAQSELDDAIATAERGVDVARRAGLGGDTGMLAFRVLADAMLAAGRAADALEINERAIAMAEEGTNPTVRSVLRSKARALTSLQRLDESEAVLLELQAHAETSGADASELAEISNTLGGLAWSRSDYASAVTHYARTIELAETVWSPDHPGLAIPLNNLARSLIQVQDQDRAMEVLERVLALDGLDPGSEAVAIAGVANVLRERGDLRAGLDLTRKSLAVKERSLGTNHPSVAFTLRDLALDAIEIGELEYAREYAERARAILADAFGADHLQTGIATATLGWVHHNLGDHSTASRHYTAARAIVDEAEATWWSAELASSHGLILQELGDIDGAEAAHRFALERYLSTIGEAHAATSATLNNLGLVLLERGDTEAAIDAFERAIPHSSQGNASWRTTANLARAHVLADRPDEARTHYQQALVRIEEVASPSHPDRGKFLHGLAELELAADNRDEAVELGREAIRQTTSSTALVDAMSEREALAFVASRRPILNSWIDISWDSVEPRETWFDLVAWKGLVRRVVGRRALAMHSSDDPEIQKLAGSLAQVRTSLAQQTLHPTGETTDDLVVRRDNLERQLAKRSVLWQQALHIAVDAEALCERTGPDVPLIDYLKVDRQDGPPHYVAFVVMGCDRITRVELGLAQPIEDAISSWRDALGYTDDRGRMATSRIDRRGAAVSELIWEPLRAEIAHASALHIVPDAALMAVPFAALPIADGRYLVEDLTTTTLDDATSLVAERTTPPRHRTALFVGGVQFGNERSGPCGLGNWAPLPGTVEEVERVSARWQKGKRRVAELITAAQAGEGQVRSALPGHTIVHLATHGFFLSGACSSAFESSAGLNPMAMSGVVLGPGGGDGLLSAEEVASLDLRGTQLVVLSACETGLGEIQSGEGVLGLRRALSQAGVDSSLISLWPVSDDATLELMDDFYRHLLRQKRTLEAAPALRRAQLDMLERQRDRGEAIPSEWAAFVSSGR